LAARVTEDLLTEVTALVPDEWLVDEPGFDTPDDVRAAYRDLLGARAPRVHERITLAPSVREKQPPPEWLRPWVEGHAGRSDADGRGAR
jgi:hypothetical protein